MYLSSSKGLLSATAERFGVQSTLGPVQPVIRGLILKCGVALMSRGLVDPDAGNTHGRKVLSCEETNDDYVLAIDSLAGWMREDIGAVASAFDVDFKKVCRDSLERLRSQVTFFARHHTTKNRSRNPAGVRRL